MPAHIRKEGDAIKAVLQVGQVWRNVHAEVGVLDGGKPHEGSNLTMGELAAAMEFGVPSRGIPARSFLALGMQRAMRAGLKDSVRRQIRDVQAGKLPEALALERIAAFLEKHVKALFKTRGDGAWAPNAPSTIKRKGHDFPLIDTRALLEAVTSRVYNAQTRMLTR